MNPIENPTIVEKERIVDLFEENKKDWVLDAIPTLLEIENISTLWKIVKNISIFEQAFPENKFSQIDPYKAVYTDIANYRCIIWEILNPEELNFLCNVLKWKTGDFIENNTIEKWCEYLWVNINKLDNKEISNIEKWTRWDLEGGNFTDLFIDLNTKITTWFKFVSENILELKELSRQKIEMDEFILNFIEDNSEKIEILSEELKITDEKSFAELWLKISKEDVLKVIADFSLIKKMYNEREIEKIDFNKVIWEILGNVNISKDQIPVLEFEESITSISWDLEGVKKLISKNENIKNAFKWSVDNIAMVTFISSVIENVAKTASKNSWVKWYNLIKSEFDKILNEIEWFDEIIFDKDALIDEINKIFNKYSAFFIRNELDFNKNEINWISLWIDSIVYEIEKNNFEETLWLMWIWWQKKLNDTSKVEKLSNWSNDKKIKEIFKTKLDNNEIKKVKTNDYIEVDVVED